MTTIYDANGFNGPSSSSPSRGRAKRMSGYHDLPDLYERPRKRMHPMLAAGIAFAAAGGLLYGAEAILPDTYKPSRFIGGYAGAIAEARASGELAARVKYDAKLKLIETGAVRWQEQCRAGLQNMAGLIRRAISAPMPGSSFWAIFRSSTRPRDIPLSSKQWVARLALPIRRPPSAISSGFSITSCRRSPWRSRKRHARKHLGSWTKRRRAVCA